MEVFLRDKKALVSASQIVSLISKLEVTLKHIREMITPGFSLVLKNGNKLMQQQEMIALSLYDQFQELCAIKAEKEGIVKAIRMFSYG
ncbi:hypothetical protein [Bartonella sp. CB175]|uniref:hypothetical protein n=1 Tax=Bartonella sp. CB175 TaxID=3112256 RepID=UPI00300DDA5F